MHFGSFSKYKILTYSTLFLFEYNKTSIPYAYNIYIFNSVFHESAIFAIFMIIFPRTSNYNLHQSPFFLSLTKVWNALRMGSIMRLVSAEINIILYSDMEIHVRWLLHDFRYNCKCWLYFSV